MDSFFIQILTLLTTPAGSLAYHLVLAFSIVGALSSSLGLWQSAQPFSRRRIIIGLSLLLMSRMVLFVFAGLAWLGISLFERLLPPLDMGVNVISLIFVVWLWVFPKPMRLADAATFLLVLLGLTLLTFTLVWWGAQSLILYFSGSLADNVWQMFALAILTIGGLRLLINRPNGWGIGLCMFGLLFLGHLVQWLLPLNESQYAGSVRLAQMAAYPFLLLLPHRLNPTQTVPKVEGTIEIAEQRIQPKGDAFRAMLSLFVETDLSVIGRTIVENIARFTGSDICLLASWLPNERKVQILCGYDLQRQQPLEGILLVEHELPHLAETLRQSKMLRTEENAMGDLRYLKQLFGLSAPVRLVSVPLALPNVPSPTSVLLLARSEQSWAAEDQAGLLGFIHFVNEILRLKQKMVKLEENLAQEQRLQKDLKEQLEQFQRQRDEAIAQIGSIQEQLAREKARSESLAALVSAHQSLQELVTNLQTENEHLKKQIQSREAEEHTSPLEVEHLEKELRQALEEIAYLKNLLAEANQKALAIEKKVSPRHLDEEHEEVLTSLTQELRQPMSSILGYTNLLLSESVGILGALQRKFLERIKAAIERMDGLIEEIVHVTTYDEFPARWIRESVDLRSSIDEAIVSVQAQIAERKIALRLDIPEQMPSILANRKAIQRILVHLLQNACAATPEGEEISLSVQTTREEDQEYILLQVRDKGGGIPPEEIPRVFSRFYRADNPLIPGLGDTGVGLYIAKTLVEAHEGRIWVESVMGVGSTFNVLLPVPKDSAPKSNHLDQSTTERHSNE